MDGHRKWWFRLLELDPPSKRRLTPRGLAEAPSGAYPEPTIQ